MFHNPPGTGGKGSRSTGSSALPNHQDRRRSRNANAGGNRTAVSGGSVVLGARAVGNGSVCVSVETGSMKFPERG